MRGRAVVVALLCAMLAVPAAARPEPTQPCAPPVAGRTPARCTFNIYGIVRDSHGITVDAAEVSDGGRAATTNAHGFYDLYVPAPGTYDLVVRSSSACSTRVRVVVDAQAAVSSGGTRRDVRMPCSRPTYNAFGFGVVQKGKLMAVARTGSWHSGHAGGIELYALKDGQRELPQTLADSAHDDRDAAGGLTRSGALVVFYARFDVKANRWSGMNYLRAAREGSSFGAISPGSNVAYSPYGPLVLLPSGRLMQTFYGFDRKTSRIYTSFSNDDGRTWTPLRPIDTNPPFSADEAAAAYLDGATDDTARIVLVARATGGVRPKRWKGLVQYLSRDGGRTWQRQGLIDATRSRLDCIPWLMALPRGRLAMVWADRGTMTIRRSITPFADAVAKRWHRPQTVYESVVPSAKNPDPGDFGYPSIVSYGPDDAQKAIVFNDLDPGGTVGYLKDVDLFVVPLWAGPGYKPVAISP